MSERETRELASVLDDLAADLSSPAMQEWIEAALSTMVLHPSYPCLGARSVLSRDRAHVEVLDELGSSRSAGRLVSALSRFAAETDLSEGFASFVAVFRGPIEGSEEAFETLLWRQLAQVRSSDSSPWTPGVSADPADPHFAFSVGGTAYFVVGLHPAASRIARRMPLPTLVFNLHEQFEQLRRSDTYPRMRDTIRRRDILLQGTPNPMVEDHGSRSEARQYSGRAVADDWQPPVVLDAGGPR